MVRCDQLRQSFHKLGEVLVELRKNPQAIYDSCQEASDAASRSDEEEASDSASRGDEEASDVACRDSEEECDVYSQRDREAAGAAAETGAGAPYGSFFAAGTTSHQPLRRSATIFQSIRDMHALTRQHSMPQQEALDKGVFINRMHSTSVLLNSFLQDLNGHVAQSDLVSLRPLFALAEKMSSLIEKYLQKPVVELEAATPYSQLATQGSQPHDLRELYPSHEEMLELLGLANKCSQIGSQDLMDRFDEYLKTAESAAHGPAGPPGTQPM
jgi:hypothetical protein